MAAMNSTAVVPVSEEQEVKDQRPFPTSTILERSQSSALAHGRAVNKGRHSIIAAGDHVADRVVAPEVATMIEVRASLKRYYIRHSKAENYFRKRFHLLAVCSLVATCTGPIIEVLEAHMDSQLEVKLLKTFASVVAILMVGLQNMMGYQTKADLHFKAADEFDDVRACFDYEVWYQCATLDMESAEGVKTAFNKLKDWLKDKAERIEEVQQKTPAVPLQFIRADLTDASDSF